MGFHPIEKISFSGQTITVDVDSGRVKIDLRKVSPVLAAASPEQRLSYEISPPGYGLHWPELDEDLSIDGLLGIQHSSKTTFVEAVPEEGPPVE